MPWNNQGGDGGGSGGSGGPWGPRGGNGGPWNRGPGGGRPQGPDLEDLLRRGQDRVRQILPGGFGGRGLILAVLAVIAIWLASGIYTIEPEEQGLVLRFGQYTRTTDPGLNYHLPYPIESVIKVPVLTVRRTEIGKPPGIDEGRSGVRPTWLDESLMLTGDEALIDVGFVVLWAVKDAQQFAFNIRNPDATVKAAAESALREVMGQTEIALALATARTEVSDTAHDVLQRILDDYQSGVEVRQFLVQGADPPQAVIDAYQDVQRARNDKARIIEEATKYENNVVPVARGEAQQIQIAADAYHDQVIKLAEGAAQRFTSIYEQYRLAEDVTRQRLYLETMEAVLQDMNKIIIDSSGGANGVVPYLPLPEIQQRRAAGGER